MRVCTRCGKAEPIATFRKSKLGKGGLHSVCRSCEAEACKKWKAANKKKVSAYNKSWYSSHIPDEIIRNKKWRENNRELMKRRYLMKYYRRLKATPSWANKFFISEAYELAGLRTRVFGFPWNVDHIVPMKSELVCGLHVEYNLQVIPRVENIVKGNRSWPDMWGD